jgi:HD-like signal output (HDOD) protein
MKQQKWTEVEDDRKLTVLLREISDVCTVSESAQRVMELTRAGEVNLTAVVDAVMKDPMLAAELLRLANSPLFGQAKQINDLKRAVVVIGMQELHNIAAAMSMMAAFASPNPLSEKLRNTSVLSAATARLTARVFGNVNESTAFLSGLLGEIGAMACTAVDTTQYTALWSSALGDRGARAKYEEARYTATSDEIAYHVLKQNRLPDDVAAAVRGNVEKGGLLGQITDLARQAAPLIIQAAEESNAKILLEDIPALADSIGLPHLDPAEWMGICLKAAATAELSLRGELMLTDDIDAKNISHLPADPAAFEMKEIVHAETEARKTQTQTLIMASPEKAVRLNAAETNRTTIIVIVVAVAAAAGAVVFWLLL